MKWRPVMALGLALVTQPSTAQDAGALLHDVLGQNHNVMNTFCQDQHCKDQAARPAQRQYYNNNVSHLGEGQLKADANLTHSGQQQLANSDFQRQHQARQAQIHRQKANGSIPSLSSLEAQYGDYVKHADVVAGGRNDKYHDCTGGVTYHYAHMDKTCIKPTNTPIACTLTRIQTGTRSVPFNTTLSARLQHHLTQGARGTFTLPRGDMRVHTLRINTIPSPLKHAWRIDILLNGKYIGYLNSGSRWDFSDHRNHRYPIATTFTLDKRLSANTFTITYRKGGRGHHNQHVERAPAQSITLTGSWQQPVMGWRHDCNEPQLTGASCAPVGAPTCTQGQATKTIGGITITEPCWQQTQSWSCQVPNTCATLPHLNVTDEHMKAGQTTCRPKGRTCQTRVAGVCIAQRLTERCTTKTEQSTDLVCTKPPELTDCKKHPNQPWCQQPHYASPSGIADALSQLAIQKAMTCGADPNDPNNPPTCKLGGFDPKTMRFFGGESKRCAKGAVGAFDCCSSKQGWAGKIGAHQCDTQAREIAMGKQKQTVIKLGTYCAKKVLGVCLRKKETYCVYPSKLARIATQGALSQLNQSLGSAKHPNCEGLTKEALAKLDFSKMDFSALMGDITPPTLPNMSKLKARYQDLDTTQTTNHGDNTLTGSALTSRYQDLNSKTLTDLGIATPPDANGHVLPDEDAIKARYQQMNAP